MGLTGMLLGLAVVFGAACWLNPYGADGRALRLGTHQRLGLPPCTFYALTGLPCPSCGMTTSFALLVRGDLGSSLKANAVGTLLALIGIVLVPWSVACLVRGRILLVPSIEWLVTRALVVVVTLMVVRWVIVLTLIGLA
jgi:hypothetical protein